MPRVTITVPDKSAQPYRFQLDRRVVSLGRASDNDLVIDSSSVSGKHAEMHRIQGGYELRDVGSTNGIKLGGERYEIIPLQHGSTVKVGDVTFDFVLTDEELQVLASEGPPVSRAKELPPVAPRQPPPQRSPQRSLPHRTVVAAPKDSGAGWMVALFVLLAGFAFFVGLSIRHQKETGTSLVDDMRARFARPVPTESAPLLEVPAADEAAPVAADTAPPAEPAPEPAIEEEAPPVEPAEGEEEEEELPETE